MDTVQEPEIISDEDYELNIETEKYHYIGRTKSGHSVVVCKGARWQLVNDKGEPTGERFHKIDEFTHIDGEQLYIGKHGSKYYILDSSGNKISEGYHSITRKGPNKFLVRSGSSKEYISINF